MTKFRECQKDNEQMKVEKLLNRLCEYHLTSRG